MRSNRSRACRSGRPLRAALPARCGGSRGDRSRPGFSRRLGAGGPGGFKAGTGHGRRYLPDPDPHDRVENVILRRGSTRLFRRRRAPSRLLESGLLRPLAPVPFDAAPAAHCSSTSSACTTSPTPNRVDTATPPPQGSRASPAATIPAAPVATSASTSRWAVTSRTRSSTQHFSIRSSTRWAAAAIGPPNSRRASLPDDWRSTRSPLVPCERVTFYDRVVSRYFHTEAAALLATAVGIPQTRPAPRRVAGQPAGLPGYG